MRPEKFASLTFAQQSTLILASHVRNEMEQFHGTPQDYLPQERMPEFNVAIRYAIHEFFKADAESDEPIDGEWIDHLSGVIFGAVHEFWERYIPHHQKYAFYTAIEESVEWFIDEYIEGLADDVHYRTIVMIPDYWEIPAIDPKPTFG